MKVGTLTWEYPPRVVGGIARHCEGLAKALVKQKHDVHLFTLDFPGAPNYEEMDGIKVYRASTELGHPNFLTWVLMFNHFLSKRMADITKTVDFDVMHIHDWLAAFSGISFKHYLKKPIVLTMHSTEVGRAQGLHSPDSFSINGIEWWATYEADRVIVCSQSMKNEICDHFNLPREKVDIIPNAIDAANYEIPVDRGAVRQSYGVGWGEKLILCVGRLVPQKGVEYFIRAIPLIAKRYPEAKFIIVGEGWSRDILEAEAQETGHGNKIAFTGFASDKQVIELMTSADVLVVPSVYEPFGIVALEGMATGVPVVASQVGGLAEVIDHDETGVFVYPRSPESLAWGIDKVLSDPDHAKYLTKNAKEKLHKAYSWEAVAMKTVEVYKKVVE
ncbi:MAG: glycosyltransferase family 4 protein [Candidatus Bathyarchaeota archaeon]|nr:MAG: glycosyltransferase family 4 protein [Candidatus Bathyarchaeota archaeon]